MSRKMGDYGEYVVFKSLKKMGFSIIKKNFYTRYGEIDIIAQKGLYTHFIEVKTSYGDYDPAENFHRVKLARFIKAVRIYCYINNISEEFLEIDLILVHMKQKTIRFIRNANLYFH